MNEKGYEDNNDLKLKFEGEYLNVKRWNGNGFNINGYIDFQIKKGKGCIKKYDDNGNILFEGEYLHTLNGKEKEYYYNGKLLYEGQYIDGERNGKGKKYDYDGKLLYEGDYLCGKRNGKGKEYYKDGKLLFEGEYLNDERNKKC